MTRADLSRWTDAYEAAWRTPGTDALDALFAPAATYQSAPFQRPYAGRDAIKEFWERNRESADEKFEMRPQIVAIEGDTGVVRVEVDYAEPIDRTYRDLWIVTVDAEGRCTAFEEWPFWPPGSKGTYAPGPPA